MSKSGLADSPFFAPAQPKVEPVISSSGSVETNKSQIEDNLNSIPDSPTPEKSDVIANHDQVEINQDQKRTNDRTSDRSDERSNERLNERPPKQKREKI